MTYETPTPEDLRQFMGAGDDASDSALQTAIDLACSDLDELLESASRPVPQIKYSQFVLEVAHAYFKRGASVSGATQYAFEGGQPIFEPKDVLNRIWPQLRRYVTPFPLPRDTEEIEWWI